MASPRVVCGLDEGRKLAEFRRREFSRCPSHTSQGWTLHQPPQAARLACKTKMISLKHFLLSRLDTFTLIKDTHANGLSGDLLEDLPRSSSLVRRFEKKENKEDFAEVTEGDLECYAVYLSRLFKQNLFSWVSKNKDCGDVRRDIRNDSNGKTKE